MRAENLVIWSADVNRERLENILLRRRYDTELVPNYIKFSRGRLTELGLPTIGWAQHLGFPVFADAKIVGIPREVVEVAKLHLRERPWMLNCMAGSCSTRDMEGLKDKTDGLKRFADACHKVGTLPCGVTVLTSKTEEMVGQEFNRRAPEEQVLWYAEILLEAGFNDLVCSPEEIAAIRSEPRFDNMKLTVPGLRLPGSSLDDQARVGTPLGAVKAGANRLVIGHDLTNGPGTLAENFQRIVDHLAPVLES